MAVSYIPRYPVILSIENHCTVPQQKKTAESLMEVLQGKVDLSTVNMNEFRKLPSPELLKRNVLVKVSLTLQWRTLCQDKRRLSWC
ncbi:1-phosphatidylinositol 4,5-bisphosphate phosphodiesterase eta-2-like [Oncorhynchus keta]|uniref:1-phosphatidylinositol 4,5-bisphosphate phosphodiesterase eta-2-like n=1 Tax=Oncorhynchus keta TaxID=8018 RepID=UPI00227BDCBA|nr:1-phosphatidylinositol 4,5-bisphosphate phosphodiesterase eta-2-like [Oncorhynchus keta]